MFHNLAFVPRSTRNEELNRVYAHETKKKKKKSVGLYSGTVYKIITMRLNCVQTKMSTKIQGYTYMMLSLHETCTGMLHVQVHVKVNR